MKTILVVAGLFCALLPLEAVGQTTWDNILDAPHVGAVIQTRGGNILAGSWAAGIYYSEDDGTTFSNSYTPQCTDWIQGNFVETPDGSVYIAIGSDVLRSYDGGANWRRCRVFGMVCGGECNQLAVRGNTIFLVESNGVMRSEDGDTWVRCSTTRLRSLVVGDDGTLIGQDYYSGDILHSLDGGTWLTAMTGFPARSGRLVAGRNGTCYYAQKPAFRSTDNGFSWAPMAPPDSVLMDVGVYQVAQNADGSVLFTVGEGMFLSQDNGGSWRNLPSTLRIVYGNVLYMDRQKRIYTGKWVSHLIRSRIAATGVRLPDASAALRVDLAPNPVVSDAQLRLTLQQADAVTITIHDILGRPAGTAMELRLEAGSHALRLPTETLPAGTYHANVRGRFGAVSRRFMRVD